MYIEIKLFFIEYLQVLFVGVSITYDGWSNASLRGFYACTLHWVDVQRGALCEVVLDFFYIAPGPGVGGRCGRYLHKSLSDFGVVDKVVAMVSDSNSDAVVAAETLQALIAEDVTCTRFPVPHHIRCFVHTFQLAIRPITSLVADGTTVLRACVLDIRSSKTKRALFRTMAGVYARIECQPPCLDCPTRLNSTPEMLRQCIKLRTTLTATIQADASLSGLDLSAADCSNLAEVEKFLRVPASVSTQVGGSVSSTIAFANCANQCLVTRAKQYVDTALPVLQEASQDMLATLLRHFQALNCSVSIIGRFLDVRVARDVASEDYKSDVHVVEMVLDIARYTGLVARSNIVELIVPDEDTVDIFSTPLTTLWDQDDELTRYGLKKQAHKDVIAWWHAHRDEFHMLHQLAIDYLSIPASSVSSERANSVAKRGFDGRATLSDEVFKAEMCTQSWLKRCQVYRFPSAT